MATPTTSPHRIAARVYGIFFLLAFLSYGAGSGIIANISGDLNAIAEARTTFTIGILLMAIVHTFVNIGLAAVMLPILKPFNKTVTYGYFAAAITATTVAIIGALFLVLLVPLSGAYVTTSDTANIATFAMLLNKGGFYAYQISMTIWGLGGLLFVYVLRKSSLVPRVFPLWGAAGYLIFITGTTAEMFGYPIGVLLSAPGGLFEVCLSLWLIFKGFSPSTKF
ncbi:hypothetical protein A9Q96_05815 [Rhodobacterales bacterium 52_120_T64]|nr:hypothetical protein A9Q96_05815 [Rhodobacterales bacterium 52_120_T64]